MHKRSVIFILLLLPGLFTGAEPRVSTGKPRLVVGIVVDQMRPDYLERFGKRFVKGGFNRLLREGFNCAQTNYSYVPTHTAPGHTCIYTGAPPAVNGIIGNDWFDRTLRAEVYCVTDNTVKPVGTTSAAGAMSPHRLLVPTVTDALRQATQDSSRVIGIALKDRGAVLPAGRSGNAAYWHDPSTNYWVTSTYYSQEIPGWLLAYNAKKRADDFLSHPWSPLFPPETYTASLPDASPYEGLFIGETQPVFPHNLPAIREKDPDLIRRTPFGNTFTLEVALEAMRGEQLGKGPATDFLAISFSSTDYIGHMYGLRAMELEDAYLRLDRDLEHLLSFLDEWVGRGNALVFLTADHGAADNVQYCLDQHLPAGNLDFHPVADSLDRFLERRFGPGAYVLRSSSDGIYFDRELLRNRNISLDTIQEACAGFLRQFPWVAAVATSVVLEQNKTATGLVGFLQRGYYPERSPDVSMILQPNWMEWFRKTGTSHGSPYAYDTHVPLIFYGWKVKHGRTSKPVDVCDIAPTISMMLGIPPPPQATGRPIRAVAK